MTADLKAALRWSVLIQDVRSHELQRQAYRVSEACARTHAPMSDALLQPEPLMLLASQVSRQDGALWAAARPTAARTARAEKRMLTR